MIQYKSYILFVVLIASCIVNMSCNQNLKVMNGNPKNEDLPKTKMDTGKYFTAVRNGDLITLENQFKNDIDINIKDTHSETGVIIATDRNDIAMVKLFLEYGADINVTSKKN